MARKVFISVLGAGLYGKCKYVDGEFSSQHTFFVQTATLEYLNVKQWSKNDVGIFLLTDFAKKSNWDKSITQRRNNIIQQDIVYKGLEKDIEDLELPIQIVPVDIPDGNNEAEIWEIFTKTFKELNNDDELYFDVTHAFRFLPMLILVLCNYAKFLKKVTVKSITYGNYEARNKKVEPNEAPIINLLPLTKLQDWTYAAGTYLDSGNVNKLVEMSGANYADFAEKLKETIADFHTCRGISVIESSHIKQIKVLMDSIDTSDLPPLKFVFDEIKVDFKKYDDVMNVKNGYESAKWCYKNQLYQQAITILIETVISDICISEKLDWKRRKNRDIASNALFIVANNLSEKGWLIVSNTEDKDKYKADYLTMVETDPSSLDSIDEKVKYKSKYYSELVLYRQLVASERVKSLVELSTMIKDVRDDIDHAGMRDGARSFAEIETKLDEIFLKLNKIPLCS